MIRVLIANPANGYIATATDTADTRLAGVSLPSEDAPLAASLAVQDLQRKQLKQWERDRAQENAARQAMLPLDMRMGVA